MGEAMKDFRRSRVRSTLPERIVFLLDLHDEMSEHWNDNFSSRMLAIKDAIGKFVRRKNNSPLRHQFALASFSTTNTIDLVVSFTAAEDDIINGLEGLAAEMTTSSSNTNKNCSTQIDLLTVLETLCGLLHLSVDSNCPGRVRSLNPNLPSSPPEHLTRCILVYGRSKEVPADSTKTKDATRDEHPKIRFIPLLHDPYCYFDVLYLHLRANEENVRCQEIFDRLSCLAHSPYGNQGQISNLRPYVLETHSSAIKLGSHMALLLAHPAQREEASPLNSRMDMNSLLAESIQRVNHDDAQKRS